MGCEACAVKDARLSRVRWGIPCGTLKVDDLVSKWSARSRMDDAFRTCRWCAYGGGAAGRRARGAMAMQRWRGSDGVRSCLSLPLPASGL